MLSMTVLPEIMLPLEDSSQMPLWLLMAELSEMLHASSVSR